MAEPIRVEWIHDEMGECVAEVGKPVRWRRIDRRSGRPGIWQEGATVVRIYEEYTWQVALDPAHRPSAWNNPIYCGSSARVTYATD